MFDRTKIKRILVISLSNIGDVVLTFPVIDILKNDFPEAELSIVVGPKGEPLLKENYCIHQVHIFNKRQPLFKTLHWLVKLRKESFDLIVDLRNTAIPFFARTRYVTAPFIKRLKEKHMLEQHLNRLKSIYPYLKRPEKRYALRISEDDRDHIDNILENKIPPGEKFMIVCAGAADSAKRWTEDGFASVCDAVIDLYNVHIVFAGDTDDRNVTQQIIKKMHNSPLHLCGRTSLTQLAYLLQKALLLLTNDSAPMHIASYFDVPVVALFGPTDPQKYGPWSKEHCVVQSKEICPKCENRKTKEPHRCMQTIKPSQVLQECDALIKKRLNGNESNL